MSFSEYILLQPSQLYSSIPILANNKITATFTGNLEVVISGAVCSIVLLADDDEYLAVAAKHSFNTTTNHFLPSVSLISIPDPACRLFFI
jgi:hypothetical protein